ncbi:uncharacterized protein LOC115224900 [Argonauta hians]
MLVEGEDKVLFRCKVLYIGSAVPMETSKGLEAIQQPLRERYPYKDEKKICGVEAILSVMPTGVQMQYIGDSDSLVWFPISSLTFCAAVRCIHLLNKSRQKIPRFVSLSSPVADGMNSQKPSIFTAIMRRTKGRKVLECHSFICSSAGEAIGLVQSAKIADRTSRNGTVTPVNRPDIFQLPLQSDADVSHSNDARSSHSDWPPDAFDSSPSHGYYYGTGSTLVRKYTVEKVNGEADPRGPRTLDRLPQRGSSQAILVPSGSYYGPRSRRIPSHPENLSFTTRRFLSPPPSLPCVFLTNSTGNTYARLPVPLSPPPIERSGNISPSLVRSPRSSSSSIIRTEDHHSLVRPRNEGSMRNGRDSESLSGSSRPPSPPQDYEPFGLSPPTGNGHTHISRKDRYERGSMLLNSVAVSPHSSAYPYDPYIYPAYIVSDPVYRPRSLPPPIQEMERYAKNSRKKKEKSKLKSKISGKKSSSDDFTIEDVDYNTGLSNGSDRFNRSILDRSHKFQNEKAFARSIAAEGKKNGLYDSQNKSYHYYPDTDIID